MPRAQVNQAIIYIFAAIMIIIILGFGYKSLAGARESLDIVQLVKLQDDLSRNIKTMSSEFGSFRKFSYAAPQGVTTVCFAEDPSEVSGFPLDCAEPCGVASVPIGPYIELEPDKNIFFFSTALLKSMKIDKLSTGCCQRKCFDAVGGRFILVLEGIGDRTKIKNAQE